MNIRSIIILLALVVVAGIAWAAPVASGQLCNAEAHAWVDSHRSELPRTYEEFSTFPLNYRRAIYSALGPERRSALWQQQIELALQREDLTDDQRSVLLEAVQLATPDLFSATKERRGWRYNQARNRIVEFEKRAREVFGNEKAGDLFGRLGPADVEIGIIRPRTAQIGVKFLDQQQAPTVGCSCSDASDWCNSAFNCTAGGCTVIRDECGTWWSYNCDGQCQLNQ